MSIEIFLRKRMLFIVNQIFLYVIVKQVFIVIIFMIYLNKDKMEQIKFKQGKMKGGKK